MTYTARAAIVESAGSPPVVAKIELPELERDEVLVRIAAAGICHTDLSCAAGLLGATFPIILGHEGAGTIEAVGPNAERFKPGDRVVISVAHHCGHCKYCEAGCPPLCLERGLSRPVYFRDGQSIPQAFATGTFSEATIVRERSLVLVPDGVPLEVAAVTGCAAVTGLGSVLNIAHVTVGSSVAVIGCGGVGMCAVMGARLAGADRIVAVDPRAERREAALQLGATDAAAPEADALMTIAGRGFDFVFEAAGRQDSIDLAISVCGPLGEIVLMGLPPAETKVSIPALDLINWGKRVTGVNMGSFRPNVDFDRYFRLFLNGRLPLDQLVSSRVPIAESAGGFELARSGEGIRVMLVP
ncbi:MAG: alcohol dehydrogenase catalytic domain-containing protein [Candidatus Dormibacteria bacterium]